jgi:hypothetical protein
MLLVTALCVYISIEMRKRLQKADKIIANYDMVARNMVKSEHIENLKKICTTPVDLTCSRMSGEEDELAQDDLTFPDVSSIATTLNDDEEIKIVRNSNKRRKKVNNDSM